MAVIYVLLPVALLFAGGALAVFLWAALSGQFDDLDSPAVRVLHDDDPPGPPPPGTAGRERRILEDRQAR